MKRSVTDRNRRRLIRAGGIGGLAIMAGCLGDDEADDVDDVDDEDPVADDDDDVDDIDDDDADDVDDEVDERAPEVHDATAAWATHHFSDLPPDVQYNPYVDPSPPMDFPWRPAHMIGFSVIDYDHHPHLVSDWSYQPGVLEFTFHEDFYWWSGDQVTVDDYLLQLEYEDFLWGGNDLDAQENIITRERVDDNTVRLTLADSWHEAWAVSQTVENFLIAPNRNLTGGWVEEFEDAPDLETIEDLRTEHEEDNVITDDDDLVNVYFSPYEFRLDGSIGEVGEDYWEFELIQEKDGNLRHHANYDNFEHLPNFARARYQVHEDATVAATELFQEQMQPFATGAHSSLLDSALAGEFDFEVGSIGFFRPPSDPGGIQYNHEVHPTDDPHFRRAFSFLVDNTSWEDFGQTMPAEKNHPFFSEDELETFVSQELIDAFTDYRYDEVAVDEAETELEAGGYERNADGDWILQEDGVEGEAGEPMSFQMGTHSWMAWVGDHGSDWLSDMNDFGIDLEVPLDLPDDWTVLFTYTGGGTPEHALGNVFLDQDWARPDYNIPSTVLAPPVGETAGAGGSTDGWEEFEVATMTERLTVTVEEEMYQALVDELVWVVNQTCNHHTAAPGPTVTATNQETWFWPDPEDVPAQHTEVGFRTPHYGVMEYRGD